MFLRLVLCCPRWQGPEVRVKAYGPVQHRDWHPWQNPPTHGREPVVRCRHDEGEQNLNRGNLHLCLCSQIHFNKLLVTTVSCVFQVISRFF